MLEFIVVAIFLWLLVKVIGFGLKLTWGLAKIAAGILVVLAMPALVLSLLFAGGLLLLLPVGLLAVAAIILRACL
jgi:hypothetical protein